MKHDPRICLEILRETMKNIRFDGQRAEISKLHFPNAKRKLGGADC
jgi:hypothetical protein